MARPRAPRPAARGEARRVDLGTMLRSLTGATRLVDGQPEPPPRAPTTPEDEDEDTRTQKEAEMPKIQTLIGDAIYTTTPETPLSETCRAMWEHDCGTIPVIEPQTRRVVGVVTDRDACMAAYTQGRALPDIPTSVAMSGDVDTCHSDDDVAVAHRIMRDKQVRRVPVTNQEGACIGMLSLHDLALHAHEKGDKNTKLEVAETLAAICRHTEPAVASA